VHQLGDISVALRDALQASPACAAAAAAAAAEMDETEAGDEE
jgi:hypothetical protein